MKAPEIKHYINWLGRVEYRNINCSFTYDETSYAAIDRIFRLLHRLEPGPENTSWKLWLRAERGTIEDFGSFEELRADGQVESFEEFETWCSVVPLCRRRGSEDRVSGNILGASACAGGGQPQRARLPL